MSAHKPYDMRLNSEVPLPPPSFAGGRVRGANNGAQTKPLTPTLSPFPKEERETTTPVAARVVKLFRIHMT
jgi:hypothetical protein